MINRVERLKRCLLDWQIMYDEFGPNHDARRTWKMGIAIKTRELVEKNKLRKNWVAIISGMLANFVKFYKGSDKAQLQLIRDKLGRASAYESYKQGAESYDDLSNEQKRERVEKIEDVVIEFLKILAQ